MPLEEIVKLYTTTTDFDEKLTKYQVEHIAGLVGGKTKYKPLNCGRMKTHGLCPGGEKLCEKVKSPLAYYRLKMKTLKKTVRGKTER
jgi:DNA primase large subunit